MGQHQYLQAYVEYFLANCSHKAVLLAFSYISLKFYGHLSALQVIVPTQKDRFPLVSNCSLQIEIYQTNKRRLQKIRTWNNHQCQQTFVLDHKDFQCIKIVSLGNSLIRSSFQIHQSTF